MKVENWLKKHFWLLPCFSKDSDYSALVEKVASKGGTTEAALKIFKNKNFDKIVLEAVLSAYKGAKELSKK